MGWHGAAQQHPHAEVCEPLERGGRIQLVGLWSLRCSLDQVMRQVCEPGARCRDRRVGRQQRGKLHSPPPVA